MLHSLVGGASSSLDAVVDFMRGDAGAALVRDQTRQLPLHVAVASRASAAIVRVLLDAAGVDARVHDEVLGDTLLALACKGDMPPLPEVIELLLELAPSAAAIAEAKTNRLPLHTVLRRYTISSISMQSERLVCAVRDGYHAPSVALTDDDGENETKAKQRKTWKAAWETVNVTTPVNDSLLESSEVLSAQDTASVPITAAAAPIIESAKSSAARAAAELLRTRAEDEQLRIVELLLKAYSPAAEVVDADGCLPLHYAAASIGPASVIAAILTAHKPGAFVVDNTGCAPLHLACMSGRVDSAVALLLLEESREMAAVADKKSRFPLHIAARTPGTQLALIKELVAAYPSAACVSTPKHGNSAFVDALSAKAPPSVLDALLDAYPEVACKKDNLGRLSIFDAIHNGAPLVIIERLISLNPGIVNTSNVSINVLQYAAREAAPLGVISALLAAGVDVRSVCSRGFTALHYAVYATYSSTSKHIDKNVVRALLNAAPATALVKDFDHGLTPLSLSLLSFVEPAVLAELLRFPEAVEIEDEKGNLPLSVLLTIGDAPPGAVAALIAAGPSARLSRNKSGRLPIDIAVSSRAPIGVVRMLLDASVADADVRHVRPGDSLLARAFKSVDPPWPDVVELLIELAPAAAAVADPATKRLPLHSALLCYRFSPEIGGVEFAAILAKAICDGGYTCPVADSIGEGDDDAEDEDEKKRGKLLEAWRSSWETTRDKMSSTAAAAPIIESAKSSAARAAAELLRTRAADEQLRIVELLLKAYSPAAEVVDADGCLPLHYAAASIGPASVIAAILTAHKPGAFVVDNTGCAPLHLACMSGRVDSAVALLLLEESREMAAVADKKSRFPLHIAAQTPGTQLALIKELVAAYPSAACVSTPKHGNFAFVDAISAKAPPSVLDALLDAYPDVTSQQDNYGNGPLVDALRHGAPIAVIERLISLNPSVVTIAGTPRTSMLHYATREAAPLSVISVLLAAGADANSVDKTGFTCLHSALCVTSESKRCDVSVVRALLDAAPAALLIKAHSSKEDICQRMPLSIALSHFVQPAILAELLRDGFSEAADIEDESGYRPLTVLLSQGDAPLGIVSALIAARPSIAQVRDSFGRSPAHWAASFKSSEAVMEFLLAAYPESGDLVDTYNLERPLDIAVRKSAPVAVIALLASNYPAAARAVDKKGRTLLSRYLREASAQADVAATRAVLSAHPNAVKQYDEKGIMPLRLAMEVNAPIAVLRLLLSEFPGAVVEAGPEGSSPLLDIIKRSSDTLLSARARAADGLSVAELLAVFPAAARTVDKDGALPLHVAASMRAASAVKALIAVDASAAREMTEKKRLPLHAFVENFPFRRSEHHEAKAAEEALAVCEALVNAYPAARAVRGPSGQLPVRTALSRGAPLVVIANLIEGAADAAEPDADGIYLLHVAIGHRAPPAVISLLLAAAPVAAGVRFQNAFDTYSFPLKIHGVSRLFPLGAFIASLEDSPRLVDDDASAVVAVAAAASTAVALLVAHPPAVREGAGSLKSLLALYQGACPQSAILAFLEHDMPDAGSGSGNESEGDFCFDSDSPMHSPLSPSAGCAAIRTASSHTDAQLRSALRRAALSERHPRGLSWLALFNWRHCEEVAPAVNELLSRICPDIQAMRALAHAAPTGARLIDAAPRSLRVLFEARLHLFGRFELADQPVHESSTSVVWLATELATDVCAATARLSLPDVRRGHAVSKSFDGALTSPSNAGRGAATGGIIRPRVALKFMRHRDQWARELSMRDALDTAIATPAASTAESVTPVLPVLDSFSCEGDEAKLAALRPYDLENHPHLLVLPAMGASLATITLSERLAEDIDEVRRIVTQVAGALAVLHARGIVHGDVKPFNIVRTLHGGAGGGFGSGAASAQKQTYFLIDLDGAARTGGVGGVKLSTAYAPPELVRGIDSGGGAVVAASAAQDMWSFGATLFALLAGRTLVHTSFSDDATGSALSAIAQWSETSTEADVALSAIKHAPARNLVARLLSRDPRARPSAAEVLRDRFVALGTPLRLASEEPLYDVMLSYRWGDAESEAVLGLSARLAATGARVWLDRERLRTGVILRRAFSTGIVQSRLFVPVVSRGVLEGADGRGGFMSLHAGSPCDNVLLESRLALECQELGLLKADFGIVPVLLGPLPRLPDARLPATAVAAVESELAIVLAALSLGTPLVKREMTTVSAVHAAVVAHLAAPPLKLPITPAALDAAAAEIIRVLKEHHAWAPPTAVASPVLVIAPGSVYASAAVVLKGTEEAREDAAFVTVEAAGAVGDAIGPSKAELIAEVALLRSELARLRLP